MSQYHDNITASANIFLSRDQTFDMEKSATNRINIEEWAQV